MMDTTDLQGPPTARMNVRELIAALRELPNHKCPVMLAIEVHNEADVGNEVAHQLGIATGWLVQWGAESYSAAELPYRDATGERWRFVATAEEAQRLYPGIPHHGPVVLLHGPESV